MFFVGFILLLTIEMFLAAAGDMYKAVAMDLHVRLSYRDDGEGYLGDPNLWQSAQEQLKNAVVKAGLKYTEETGEAAFYGPKIDFMATDALERQHQLATVQLDFVQPERFGLEYVTQDGTKQMPVMIHSALLGSVERFLSVYIEHTAGKFPVWLAPEQVRVIQVKDSQPVEDFVQNLVAQAKELGVRVRVDTSNESVGKKIRAAEVLKVPYSVVVGEKEVDEGKLTPRIRKDLAIDGHQEQSYDVENFLQSVANEATARVQKSSI